MTLAVKQYGNFLYYTDDSEIIRNEVKLELEKNMKDECEKHSIDYSKGKVDFIFKEVDDIQKLNIGCPYYEDLWTGAWKVTL